MQTLECCADLLKKYPSMKYHPSRRGLHSIRSLCALVALTLAAGGAFAVEPFTLRDIRVEGLQRVEPGTLFASLPFRVGETYSDEKGTAAIRALFALGLFKDVRLEVKDNVLVVIVEERPTIANVDFVGAKEFDKDALKKALREVGLTDGRPFDAALADKAEQEIKRQYISRSLYAAEVVTTVTPIERNRVNLTFSMTEGEVAKIKEIRIVGHKAFSESTLRGLFELDTGGWMSWYTKSDRYSRAKLNADLETLRSYYLSRGYLEFRVDSTQVSIAPNKQDVAIAINITEGEKYTVAAVKLEGNYLGKEDAFKGLVKIRPGQAYNAEQVSETTKAFTDYFATFGYAFARVEVVPEIDRSKNLVTFVLQGDPGRRAYVRRINIAGNTKTRDEVIRREIRQLESSWYDGDRIRLSRDRVDRLGFFKDVNVDTIEVPGAPDQVDLNFGVTEKPTGNLSVGAGFSSAEKLSFTAGIKQENVFGSGNYLGLEVNTSKFNRTLALTTVNPYFTADGVSRALDLYYRTSKPYTDQGGNYSLASKGASVRFGLPLSELDTVFLGIGLESTRIKPGTNIPAVYVAYADKFGYSSTAFPATLGWARDGRDSLIAPTSGRYQRVSADLSLFGDVHYMRGTYQFQEYFPISRQFTLGVNAELGLGKGLSGQPYPVFKNFTSGGLGSVRGFEQGTLGPRDVTGSTIGGNRKFNLNAELYVPFPGMGNDRSLRLFGFYDIGNVYGEDEKMSFSTARSSVGLGVSWLSPMGPLRFAIANPVRKFAGDRIQKLQFQIGTAF